MAGVYFHVPFCTKACHYCDFHFSTNHELKTTMLASMLEEWTDRRNELKDRKVHTIYFGGGTPSVLNPAEIKAFIDSVTRNSNVVENPEITVECNPEDLNSTVLDELRKAGVNRLSIGIQTFRNEALASMNRAHDADQALGSIQAAREAGFTNISADLIYGTPGSTLETCKEDVGRLIDLGLAHVSTYILTIEKGTAYQKFLEDGKLDLPDDEATIAQYELGAELLKDAGFEQYELSNHAKPGYRSAHNSSYWSGTPYIGIGPSAHSFDGMNRRWNVSNNARYLKRELWYSTEELTDIDRYNEYVMIGLRTSDGCDPDHIRSEYGEDRARNFEDGSQKWITSGHIARLENKLTLTRSGRLISNRIMEDLFLVNEG